MLRDFWWTGEDSNLRSSKERQVYSLLPLTARPPVRVKTHDTRSHTRTPKRDIACGETSIIQGVGVPRNCVNQVSQDNPRTRDPSDGRRSRARTRRSKSIPTIGPSRQAGPERASGPSFRHGPARPGSKWRRSSPEPRLRLKRPSPATLPCSVTTWIDALAAEFGKGRPGAGTRMGTLNPGFMAPGPQRREALGIERWGPWKQVDRSH